MKSLLKATTDVISDKDFQVSSQFAHFFTAAYIAAQSGRFGWKGMVIAGVGLLLWASVKEGWYDEKFETPLQRGSSLLDWSMYVAGTIAGLLTRV